MRQARLSQSAKATQGAPSRSISRLAFCLMHVEPDLQSHLMFLVVFHVRICFQDCSTLLGAITPQTRRCLQHGETAVRS